MDVINVQLQPQTINENPKQNQDFQIEKKDVNPGFPTQNVQKTKLTPKKSQDINFQDSIATKMVNSIDINKKTSSPSNRSRLKNKPTLIDDSSSPKQSPKRKRKRYLSNPSNNTEGLLNSPATPNEMTTQSKSPSTAIRRRRRRSASLSIDNSNNSPKENKNNENLPINSKPYVPLSFDKNISSPQKTFRTPPKRQRALSGSENDVNKASQVSSRESVQSPCNSPSNKGPPSTTIWRWSPIRGKFKPKSIEYQNGTVVLHPEDDEFLLATPFKSKWQSVSLLMVQFITKS